ncbi:hypothetical protein [Brevibacillus sp. FSL K6-2834]|uniref:hypothetical protein n=1 Tax=Brevibacillus sp. FSL K6-2834 TaxID=2954680 RepID=UPI003158B585
MAAKLCIFELQNTVARVLNEIAPNDEWVRHMPENFIKRIFPFDPLFGRSGVDGFNYSSPILTQSRNSIFTHNNVIKRDVIEKKWIPFLNANKEAYYFEGMEYSIRKNKIKPI